MLDIVSGLSSQPFVMFKLMITRLPFKNVVNELCILLHNTNRNSTLTKKKKIPVSFYCVCPENNSQKATKRLPTEVSPGAFHYQNYRYPYYLKKLRNTFPLKMHEKNSSYNEFSQGNLPGSMFALFLFGSIFYSLKVHNQSGKTTCYSKSSFTLGVWAAGELLHKSFRCATARPQCSLLGKVGKNLHT